MTTNGIIVEETEVEFAPDAAPQADILPLPSTGKIEGTAGVIHSHGETCSSKHFITLENVSCVDADGNVFESYDTLHVAKDVFLAEGKCNGEYFDRTKKYFNPYDAIVYAESQGKFVPSFPLMCNILLALKKDSQWQGGMDCRVIGELWEQRCFVNTVVDFATQRIVNYPPSRDFGQKKDLNAHRFQAVLPFRKVRLRSAELEQALWDVDHVHFVRQLTGVSDPYALLDYLQWPSGHYSHPRLEFPWEGVGGASFQEKMIPIMWRSSRQHDRGIDFSDVHGDFLDLPARGVYY